MIEVEADISQVVSTPEEAMVKQRRDGNVEKGNWLKVSPHKTRISEDKKVVESTMVGSPSRFAVLDTEIEESGGEKGDKREEVEGNEKEKDCGEKSEIEEEESEETEDEEEGEIPPNIRNIVSQVNLEERTLRKPLPRPKKGINTYMSESFALEPSVSGIQKPSRKK